ncbi:hypothetical protein CVT24_002436 [Panaeolus cyanescens]|uniref:Uncharacterized protein n=1 Tax=Panaeolus cyanescens TaxID=181874 RepID=A0A409X005_9AGAR|nr:hypothetical protein CVT24_002436 [Panaeolus cyanescens]
MSSTLRMTFNPATLRPNEQPEITRLCNIAWTHQALRDSTEAIVYSAPGPQGRVWWHVTVNDPVEHITVRYNRRANRVHVYRNGSVNVSPQKPTRMRLKGAPEADEEYDSASELSGEDFDE